MAFAALDRGCEMLWIGGVRKEESKGDSRVFRQRIQLPKHRKEKYGRDRLQKWGGYQQLSVGYVNFD